MIATRPVAALTLVLATLLTTSCGKEATTSPGGARQRVISGRIVPAGDVGPMTGIRITLRSHEGGETREFSGLADASGAFRFDADFSVTKSEMLDFIVASDAGPQRFTPVYKRIAADDSNSYLRPLVIARTVVIPSGNYAGMAVQVSLDDAFTPICPNIASAACVAFFGFWSDVPLLWPEEDLPIELAIFRREGAPVITAQDSVVFWANVALLEAEFGRDLFRPVDVKDLGFVTTSGTPVRGITVAIDPAASPAFGGATPLNGRLVLGIARANNIEWFRLRYVMNHELVHALGFGHTCSWTSLMCGASAGRPSATSGDVAAFVLAYQIDKAIRNEMPTTTLADALAGERILASK